MVTSCNHVSSSRFKLAQASRVKFAEQEGLYRIVTGPGIKIVIRMVNDQDAEEDQDDQEDRKIISGGG